MEASVRHDTLVGALTSRSSVLVREGFDLDTLTEFQGCRFGECDLDRHDPGVDRPPGSDDTDVRKPGRPSDREGATAG